LVISFLNHTTAETLMSRKISTKKYLLAFFLTLLIFSGGIFIGMIFEEARLNQAKQISLEERISLRSLQLQQEYIESGIADCEALNQVLNTNLDELGSKMNQVLNYEKNTLFNENEFNLILRDYFLTEIQYLLTSQEIDQKCDKNNIKIIYFYDESSYDTQGDILGYIKKLFKNNVLIFSFNSDFKDEPMINLLLTSYDVKEFPSVIVEDKLYQGHNSVEKMKEIICENFSKINKKPLQCRV